MAEEVESLSLVEEAHRFGVQLGRAKETKPVEPANLCKRPASSPSSAAAAEDVQPCFHDSAAMSACEKGAQLLS